MIAYCEFCFKSIDLDHETNFAVYDLICDSFFVDALYHFNSISNNSIKVLNSAEV
ncbi:hypothetical protein BH18THE1_BH18THE1_10050 [soil metagenome]